MSSRSRHSRKLELEILEERIVPCTDELGLNGALLEGSPAIGTFPTISPSGTASTSTSTSTAGSGLPVPAYSSLPGANAVLYLNFGGDTVSSWLGYTPGTIPAYSTDSDVTTFSASELNNIYLVWQQVSEDYAPFNINVTTVDPRTVSGFSGHVSQIDIGGNGAWTGGTYGGIGQVGGFGSSSATNPVRGFVFPTNLGNGYPKYVAEASSHESGHNMGLWHQSAWSGTTKTAEYQTGPGDGTAPIMGNSYSYRGLWWYGLSSQGTGSTYQDDMAIISSSSNGYGYRADEAGNTAGTASPLSLSGNSINTSGIITTMSDLDYWSFATDAGTISFTVSAPSYGNLHPKFELVNSSGTVIVGWQDLDALSVSWSGSLAAGTYRIVVASHGVSSGSTSTNYGFDVGQYTITGSVLTPANFVAAPTNLTATALSSSQINLAWADNAGNETSYSVERSTDGNTWGVIATLGANSTSYANTGLTAGATYYYRVRAFNGTTPSDYSNQASAATTQPPPNAPSSLAASHISSNQIHLSWFDNANNETAFYIERATYNKQGALGSFTQIAQVGANVTSFDDFSVTSRKYYTYRVRAGNAGGYSAYASLPTGTKIQGGQALGESSTLESVPGVAGDVLHVLASLKESAESVQVRPGSYLADFTRVEAHTSDSPAGYLASLLNNSTGQKSSFSTTHALANQGGELLPPLFELDQSL